MRRTIMTLVACLGCCVGLSYSQTATPATPDNSTPSSDDSRILSIPPISSTEQREFQEAVKDVHFDFDRADLRDQDRSTIATNAQWLKAHPDVYVTLEGDADDRGDIVYNLVLSGERAAVTKASLVEQGVPADHILFATGWGKLYPICSQADESCWSQNRRTHFAVWPALPEATQMSGQVEKSAAGQ